MLEGRSNWMLHVWMFIVCPSQHTPLFLSLLLFSLSTSYAPHRFIRLSCCCCCTRIAYYYIIQPIFFFSSNKFTTPLPTPTLASAHPRHAYSAFPGHSFNNLSARLLSNLLFFFLFFFGFPLRRIFLPLLLTHTCTIPHFYAQTR